MSVYEYHRSGGTKHLPVGIKKFPPPTPEPCNDCPWRRDAKPRWLGPYSAEEWIEIAHSDSPVACHQTITEVNVEGVGDWDHPAMRQCRGAAIFRANVGKSPRNPTVLTGPADRERVFASNQEFTEYHNPRRSNAAHSRDHG